MRVYPIVLIVMLGVSACSKQDGQEAASKSTARQGVSVMRNQNTAQIQRGHQLFEQNCAACHGANAQGAANWSKPGPDGKYPPPPLNGTGHAWHHPKRALILTIQHGTIRLGGNMPAWQGRLSIQDSEDIIAWFQSLWPDELYAAWLRRDQADKQGER
ncbi:MAG: cytochrome c [Gammaproteobacteria bacterium]